MILRVRSTTGDVIIMRSYLKGWRHLSSLIFLEPKDYSRVIDKGPIMVSKLSPILQKTDKMGIEKEWECQAYADGDVTYRWYKNNQVSYQTHFFQNFHTAV